MGWAEDGEPWDALAEDYEPGCTAADVEQVFKPLRKRLQTLLDSLMDGPNKPYTLSSGSVTSSPIMRQRP